MTRKEQIRQASIDYQLSTNPRAIGGDAFADMAREMNVNPSFIAGAIWSDNNPSPAEDIRPIPLTEEFFEKNGFKFLMEDGKYKTLCLNEPYINCTFVKEFKDWIITVGAAGSVKKRFVEVSKVQFVHEFQHMLRLCGYDMDVVV